MKLFQFTVNMCALWCMLFIFSPQAHADIWRIMPGQANDIAIGANGQIWAIGNAPTGGGFNIVKWNGTTWEAIGGGGVRIAVDPKGMPWVINNGGQVWQWNGTTWVARTAAGAATDIGIGANGQVWIVTLSSTPGGFRLQSLINNSWTNIDGAGNRISVGPNGQPWIVNSSGQIYERINGRWDEKTGSATDISVGANGVVWVIGRNAVGGSFGVHRWDGNSNWNTVDGGGTQIAVDHFGRPIITNHLKEIYRREYTPTTLSATPRVIAMNMDYYAAGRISAICVNPSNPNHVIVSGETGGLFETTNARSTTRSWTHLRDFDEFSVTDILILPLSDGGSEVYVTCSDSYKNPATPTPLIYMRSASGGRSWTRVGFSASTNIAKEIRSAYRLVKSKTDNTIYAAGKFGIFQKPEGSAIWSRLGMPPGSGVTALEAMSDGTLIVGVESGLSSGVYYSPDNGTHWHPAVCPSPLPSFRNSITQRFALKADASGQIVMLSKYTGSGVQLFGSVDYGRSWTAFRNQWGTGWVASRIPGGGAGGFESILPVFNTSRNRLEIYVSNAENIFYGYSSGTTAQAALTNALNNATFPWQPGVTYSGGVGFNAGHEDTRQLIFLEGTPRKMGITSDGGISFQNITSDNPETFPWVLENSNTGLNALQAYNVTGSGRELYFGTQDNSYGYNSNGDGRVWSAGGGKEGYVLNRQGVGYDNPWTLYGLQANFGKMTGNFIDVNDCSPAGSPGRWNAPTGPGRGIPIWFGAGIYIQDDGPAPGGGSSWKITYDNGCTWSNMPNSTFPRGAGEKAFFSSTANSPFNMIVTLNNSGTTVIGRFANPLNTDPANTWQYPSMSGLTGGIAVVGRDFLTNPVLAVNPNDPQHMIACESSTGKLKIIRAGSSTWTEVSTFTAAYEDRGRYSLKSTTGNVGIWSIDFSPYDPQIVLLGTVARGLFISRDGGNNWTRLNFEGLFQPTDFHWKSPQEVIVSTNARGLFRISF